MRTTNITKDMVAFNALGLTGVIDELLANSVKIKPLHDISTKIPAKNSRTLENLIIVGAGKPKSFLIEDFKKKRHCTNPLAARVLRRPRRARGG